MKTFKRNKEKKEEGIAMGKMKNMLGALVAALIFTGCANVQESVKNTAHDSGLDTNKQIAEQEVNQDSTTELKEKIHQMLPKPTSGYVWKVFRGVAIQRPAKWNEYSEGGTYCSSVESVSENRMFETGVTIQVIRDVEKKTSRSPSQLISIMLRDLAGKPENKKLIYKVNKHDDLDTVVFRYRNAPPKIVPIVVHQYFQVSDKNDFLNIITFETTEKNWDKYWASEGETILSNVATVPYFNEE